MVLQPDSYDSVPALLHAELTAALTKPLTLPERLERNGAFSQVFQARLEGREVIIKLTSGRNSYPAEVFVYARLAQCGLPTPVVIFHAKKLETLAQACLVLDRLPGVSLLQAPLTPVQRVRVYRSLGEVFGCLHATPGVGNAFGYGAFVPGTPTAFTSWRRFLEDLHACQTLGGVLRKRELLGIVLAERLQTAVEACLAHTFAPVLLHGDLGPDHVFVHCGALTGIIDPGNAFPGPAEYDLAYFRVYLGQRALREVLAGYRLPFSAEYIRSYSIVITAHKASRAHAAGNDAKRDFFLRQLRLDLTHQRGSKA